MNRFGYRALVGAATALLAAVTVSAASAQTTYFACRVPGVNIIYIRGTLVSDPCIDAAHVQFQWTDGGAPADGSITTAKLADNSVTTAKIVNGTIAAADLAAGLVPGVEFGADYASFDPGTAEATAASMTLSHPASGFIVAHFIGQILCSAQSNLSLGITNGTTGNDGWSYSPGFAGYTMVQKQEVLTVTGAGTATLNANIRMFTDNCTFFHVINFDAIYVPVRY